MKKHCISIVISVYNEEKGIFAFWKLLTKSLNQDHSICYELLWVNDGSTDNTQIFIDKITSENSSPLINFVVIEFSKNFGHESAMIAGIDNATGDAVICMDSDGQHPPKEIHKMINAFLKGNEVVLMKRIDRKDSGLIKKSFSRLFYKIINFLSVIKFEKNSTDFFLVSKRVAKVLKKNYRDQNRFIRGFVQSVGFSKTIITFSAPARLQGESNYSYWKLLKLAFSAIFSFSNKPLRISIGISILFILLTLALCGYTLYMYIYGSMVPSGYTTIIIFLSASFSTLFIALSVLSLYFEKLIKEVHKRPIYIIKRKQKVE